MTNKHTATAAMAGCLMLACGAWGGNLNPSGPLGSTMHTLEEIYTQLLETQEQLRDLGEQLSNTVVQTTSPEAIPAPSGMVRIAAGKFLMGDSLGEGHTDALPLHLNTISTFYMDKTETTKAKWDTVYIWAVAHGYDFENDGMGKGLNHPVHSVNWNDCLKWANARSEMEGLSSCYLNEGGTVYRSGSLAPMCNWYGNGYRLPTEAEWEKAARGGEMGMRFPWDDSETIQHGRANYNSNPTDYTYDTGPNSGNHPDYDTGDYPYTSPVASFDSNGYGLYDMAGNLFEWCWDWYGEYTDFPTTDPSGPSSGSSRVVRGGSWYYSAYGCRVANRFNCSPDYTSDSLGLRLVRAAQ